MTAYDSHLPGLQEHPEDSLETYVWSLLDGPRGHDIVVPENVLRAGIECWRLLAAGDGSCSDAALQIANTMNRRLPVLTEMADSPWFSVPAVGRPALS
ncbi:hypothetical protein ABT034_33635 [Streptomyces sp. NPDC002773]|uniref:hypothetical protein n=1 Tax=Streptomyces sp. NPDC002773 TaxID=3154430 RepID=UPI00332F3DAB